MSEELVQVWRQAALAQGFEFFGVTAAARLQTVPFPPHRGLARPLAVMPEARSVLVLGLHAWDPLVNAIVSSVIPDDAIPFDEVPGQQYYHFDEDITEVRAHRLCASIREAGFKAVATHAVHEKAAAALAGLGAIGKQTLCITPTLGPRVRWVCILTDAQVPSGEEYGEDLCGDCDLCVRACPTQAIIPGSARGVEPGTKVDFSKCIIPQSMLSEPNEAYKRWGKRLTERGHTACLICLDACPVGRDEHRRRVECYRTKPSR